MKLATYNIWNDERGGEIRQLQVIEEIRAADADIIGLQEVTPRMFEEKLVGLYPYAVFRCYAGEEEGLAILSRYPILEGTWLHECPEYDCSAGLNAVMAYRGKRLSVTNAHLPWDSALAKERQIVAINRFVHARDADIRVLLGDFNGSLNSSVHRYLVGDQSLMGCEANPYWYVLSSTYAAAHHEPVPPTLDFLTNPRWGGRNSTEIPCAADRIYVMYHEEMDDLRRVERFGMAVSPESGYAASDHYGVVAEIEFG